MSSPLTSFLIFLKEITHAVNQGPLTTTQLHLQTPYTITSLAECELYFYIGTTHGLISKNKQNGKIRILTTKNSGLPSNFITSLLCTSHGKVYFGTIGGLVQLKSSGFRPIIAGDFIKHDTHITALAEDNAGIIWIGTHSGILKTSRSTPGSYKVQSITFPHKQVNTITVDTRGFVWVGYTCGGIEWFRNGISYNYASIKAIELTRLQGASPFLLTSRQEGAFICDEKSVNKIAQWTSYPNITCAYYNPAFSRMIICNRAGINIYSIKEPGIPPRSMLYSEFLTAISCQNRDREVMDMINLLVDYER